ncbi:MAG: 16S rRNA (cytosine(1402)-N(4))-methyltransferase RsmH [Wenzhouxiangella sp.]
MAGETTHVPVLLGPALDALRISPDGVLVDGTYGRGGHSSAMLEQLGPDGRLVVIDQDPEAIADAQARFGGESRVTIWPGNFGQLEQMGQETGVAGRVTGLLLDIGVSSPQLDDPARGFSFREDGPLDMRMNNQGGQTAAEWLAEVEESTLAGVIKEYGEERHARRIARQIVMARSEQPIETTARLAAVVARAAGPSPADRHPATRTFQAIRIHINDELGSLDQALDQAVDLLAPGGRLAVISFHSLEDRRVKQVFRRLSSPPPASRRAPMAPDFQPRLRLVGRMIKPDAAELGRNPRARSACLRVAERLGEAA